jgi:hypothetical protein
VQEVLRAHHEHLGATEGEADLPYVQGHERDPAIQQLHDTNQEEELMRIVHLAPSIE